MIRLLLVDDDVANSEFLIEYLRMEGFDVLYAKDGNQGWNLYRQKAPHLMLLDVNMPGYNGFELARKVRAVDDKVIIFFLTDRVGKEDRLTGFNIKVTTISQNHFIQRNWWLKSENGSVAMGIMNYIISVKRYLTLICPL